MFGVGPQEMVIIGLIILVIFGRGSPRYRRLQGRDHRSRRRRRRRALERFAKSSNSLQTAASGYRYLATGYFWERTWETSRRCVLRFWYSQSDKRFSQHLNKLFLLKPVA